MLDINTPRIYLSTGCVCLLECPETAPGLRFPEKRNPLLHLPVRDNHLTMCC